MKKTILLFSSVFFISMNVAAQTGAPAVKIFSNFNYDISTEEGENPFKAFEVKRSYLGYSYKINDRFSTKITFDVGNNEAGSSYTAFLKIASLKWKASDNLNLNVGMVGTKNFKFMEKAWGKRYIYKSLQDQQKWASAADAGASIDYSFSNSLSIDMQILNGDGYKKVQGSDGLMRGGAGITYKKGAISIRASQDLKPRISYTENDATQTISTIAGMYNISKITMGGEYNIQENTDNVLDNTKTGMSAYADFQLNDNYSLFGRYDQMSSENVNGEQWNIDKDGTLTIFGIQRKMTKGVTIALNMQTWQDATLEGEEEAEAESTLYINLEYKF
ncbi:MAG: hypothetical protein VX370_01145 [Bacteroidota bacterium]|nr:hypothetical protein [Bacteroidota bacterium]